MIPEAGVRLHAQRRKRVIVTKRSLQTLGILEGTVVRGLNRARRELRKFALAFIRQGSRHVPADPEPASL